MLPTKQDDPVIARITNGLPPVLPSLAKPSTPPPMSSSMPNITSAGLPPVTTPVQTPEEQRYSQIKAKLDKIPAPATTQIWDKASQYHQDHPGVLGRIAQVGAGVLRGVDIAGETLMPRVAQNIPGSILNQGRQVKTAEGELKDAAGQVQELHKTPETRAFEGQESAGRTPMQSYADVEAAKRAPAKPDKAESFVQEGVDRSVADIAAGKDPNEDPAVLQLADANSRFQRQPATPQDHYMKSQKMVGGKLHDFMTNERTKEQTDLGETKQPGAGSGGAGPWMVDANGRFYHPQIGAIMPEGSQTVSGVAGTETKKIQSTNTAGEAANYAKSYLASGQFSGPGDEAMMDKFFELAKPSSGFRMTQPQLDMLQHGRSWMDSAEAKTRHATEGTWFSDDQRRQIVNIMSTLQNSKGTTKGVGAEFHSFTYNGQQYENVPDATYKKVKGKPGFSE